MPSLWDYGGAWRSHDMSREIALPNDSRVAVCDLTVAIPEFMKRADVLLIDPPWTTGNLRSFYTKADLEHPGFDFLAFTAKLWERIDAIAPRHLFVEMGKAHLWRYLAAAEQRYRHVTFYNATYYGKRSNKCYLVHATDEHAGRRYAALEDLDEARQFDWIVEHMEYGCIGDLCMGRGGVGRRAYACGRPFVGIEINPKRLACLVEHIAQAEKQRAA